MGCGPAGLSAAIACHQRGHEVELFERFDAPQPLGSGIILQPTGLAVLDALGCRDAIMKLGHVINTMSGQSMPSNKQVLNVEYSALGEGMHGLAVHRAALFEVLFAKVTALGVPVHTSTEIRSLSYTTNGVVPTSLEQHGEFDLCVDASGANSALHVYADTPPKRRWLKYGAIWGSLDWPTNVFRENVLSQRYVAAHTMIGVLPIGRHAGVERDQAAFFWSMPSADYATWKANDLNDWKSQVRSIWPETDVLLEHITSHDQMTMARYGHHTLAKPYGKRLAFIGDSAHATSPQLGQGANMGLLDAWALGFALGNPLGNPLGNKESTGPNHTNGRSLKRALEVNKALHDYARIRRWHVRLFQLASLSLTPFYQSDGAVLAGVRDLCFDPVSRLPVAKRLVAGLVTGLLTNPLERMGLSARSETNALDSNRRR
ncbi:MAG: FAD-dependent oxidoreductase [Gammaproteobacteria bacterium]